MSTADPSSAAGPAESGRSNDQQSGRRRRSDPLARPSAAVFAALVIATGGGLLLAQRLKHTPTAVHSFLIAPATLHLSPAGKEASEQVSFQLDHHDSVSVYVVNGLGETVAELVHQLPWPAYLRLCLTWNGRRGSAHLLYRSGKLEWRALGRCAKAPMLSQPAAGPAASGEYRVKVELSQESRTVLSPSGFTVAYSNKVR